jgi:polyisoprenoid-binding protein YceI
MVRLLHRWRWIVVAIAVLAIVLVAGVVTYERHFSAPAPAKLALPPLKSGSSTSPASSAQAALDGAWNLGPATVVGYRVAVGTLGLHKTIVGRTNRAWGSVAVRDGRVARGSFTVDMTSFRGGTRESDLIDAKAHPTATFVLTGPIKLDSGSADGAVRHYTATGRLTLRGVTTPVAVVVSQERKGTTFWVLADISIAFARWHVPVPSGVKSRGTIEVLLGLVRGAGNRAPAS